MNSPAPSLSDLLHHIASGAYDGEANAKAIVGAINARARAVSAAAGAAVAASLVPGDRVRITGEVRPKHFLGKEGTVTALPARGKIAVRLDGDIIDTKVPPAILTKVADKVVESALEAEARLIVAFKAEHDQYPQYAGRTDGAVAVPLRKAWNHRGMNLPKGEFVLLLPYDNVNPGQSKPGSTPWSEIGWDGTERVSVWHPNLSMTTITDPSDVVMPKVAK